MLLGGVVFRETVATGYVLLYCLLNLSTLLMLYFYPTARTTGCLLYCDGMD